MEFNSTVFIIECVVLVIAFTGMIMIPLIKSPIWWIHDYPEEIQEEYFKTHEKIPTKPFSKTVFLKKSFAIFLALAMLTGLVILAGAEHMDKAYHQKKYHFVHSVIGMGLGLIPCLLCGLIVMLIK